VVTATVCIDPCKVCGAMKTLGYVGETLPCRFTPGQTAAFTHWTGGWVGLRLCWTLPRIALLFVGSTARSLVTFELKSVP
jgi:hypothetical protein